MKAKKMLTLGSLAAFIILVVVVLLITVFDVFKSEDEKAVEDVFNAQMELIQGDKSALADLELEGRYGNSVELFLSTTQFGEAQSLAVDKALDNFTYDIKEVNIIEGKEGSYPMTVEVVYTVDAYPIVDSLSDDYLSKPEDHLTDEELELFNNGTDEEKGEMVVKLVEAYQENVVNVKPVTEKHSVAYIVYEDGTVEFAQGNDISYLIKSVLGMASDSVVE